ATETETPTRTATATLTPTVTRTPTATRTSTAILTPAVTVTEEAGPTDIPLTPERETYYTTTGANLRPCPYTSAQCAPIGTLAQGAVFEATGSVRGEVVSGSAIWFKGNAGGREGYVHSSILSA